MSEDCHGVSEGIEVIQNEAIAFYFDTITWPADVFEYPIVWKAVGSDPRLSGLVTWTAWRSCSRLQFEWLIRHHSCVVAYTGAVKLLSFYCYNHQCWECDGINLYEIQDPQIQMDIDYFEEREI